MNVPSLKIYSDVAHALTPRTCTRTKIFVTTVTAKEPVLRTATHRFADIDATAWILVNVVRVTAIFTLIDRQNTICWRLEFPSTDRLCSPFSTP